MNPNSAHLWTAVDEPYVERTKCAECGKKLTERQEKYCSRRCLNTVRGRAPNPAKKHMSAVCEVCGKTYSVKRSLFPKTRFCSKQCCGKHCAMTRRKK